MNYIDSQITDINEEINELLIAATTIEQNETTISNLTECINVITKFGFTDELQYLYKDELVEAGINLNVRDTDLTSQLTRVRDSIEQSTEDISIGVTSIHTIPFTYVARLKGDTVKLAGNFRKQKTYKFLTSKLPSVDGLDDILKKQQTKKLPLNELKDMLSGIEKAVSTLSADMVWDTKSYESVIKNNDGKIKNNKYIKQPLTREQGTKYELGYTASNIQSVHKRLTNIIEKITDVAYSKRSGKASRNGLDRHQRRILVRATADLGQRMLYVINTYLTVIPKQLKKGS